MINKLTGNTSGITLLPRREWDKAARKVAFTERSKRILAFQAKTDLSYGLKKTIQWFKQNRENIDIHCWRCPWCNDPAYGPFRNERFS